MNADEKECPFCAEVIKAKAVKCRFCGEMLTEPRVPSAPDSEPAQEPVRQTNAEKPTAENKTAPDAKLSPGCIGGCGALCLFPALQGFSDGNAFGGAFWLAVGLVSLALAAGAGAPASASPERPPESPSSLDAPRAPEQAKSGQVSPGVVVVAILLTLICSGFLYVYQRDYALPGRDSQERAERAQAAKKEEAYDKMMQRREDWGRQKEVEAKRRIEELKKHPDYPGKR